MSKEALEKKSIISPSDRIALILFLLTLVAVIVHERWESTSSGIYDVYVRQSYDAKGGDIIFDAREEFAKGYKKNPFGTSALLESSGDNDDCNLHIVTNISPANPERTLALRSSKSDSEIFTEIFRGELQPVNDIKSLYEFRLEGLRHGDYQLLLPHGYSTQPGSGEGFFPRNVTVFPDCSINVAKPTYR